MSTPPLSNANCVTCLKIQALCVCPEIKKLKTTKHVLILQHPQEPDKDLGSALITHLSLPNSTLKIGLSWPNLKKALGREAMPSRWAVLYLGSGTKTEKPRPGLQLVSKAGVPLPDQNQIKADLEGIIVLDGTWSQAKTIWWRNAWLLKLRRAILTPSHPSLYRELRREPRGECLSTIESIAHSLDALGESPEVKTELSDLFKKLLEKQRSRLKLKQDHRR